MTLPISSLANMEYMLYGGGLGFNPNCPSYLNGYRANSAGLYSNPYMYNGMYQNAWNNPYYNNSQSVFSKPNNTVNTEVAGQDAVNTNNKDLDTLCDYYRKSLAPSESLTGAAIGGAAFGLVNNTRFIAHPINSFFTIGKVEKMFADVKNKGSKMYELWRNPETHKIMTDAYARMHKLEGGAQSRLGLFKLRLDKVDKDLYNSLKSEMEAALRSGDKEAIATATEKIRIATNAKTGYIPQGWRKAKEVLGFKSKAPSIAEKLADKNAIKSAVQTNMAEKSASTLSQQFKHSLKGQGGMGGVLMFGMEYLFDWQNIQAAFSKDKETGWKQVGQTTAKGLGALAGWAAGEAVGAWAGAKIGAMAGTAIAPGIGTAIGAVAGLIGGSIGCALMGKFTKKLVGEDVGAKVLTENMKKTPEGQVQLIQMALAKAQAGEEVPQNVLNAAQNAAQRLSA